MRKESKQYGGESADRSAHCSKDIRRVFAAAITYFAIVFGAGFVLGPIRILLLVPRIGERWAELLETPVMVIVIVFAAKWITRKFEFARSKAHVLGVGLLALCLGLAFEFGLVLWLRGLNLKEYLQTRDPVSGSVYYLTLCLFAVMPLLLRRKIQEA